MYSPTICHQLKCIPYEANVSIDTAFWVLQVLTIDLIGIYKAWKSGGVALGHNNNLEMES